MTEFEAWSNDIADLYGLPDHVSTKWALATMIVSLPPDRRGWSQFYKSKRYFGICALKSMSNQIAAGVMEDLKAKQRAAALAEQEAQKAAAAEAAKKAADAAAAEASKLTVVPDQNAEATAATQVASNVLPIQN
jgi:hypothetical protein